MNNVITRTDKPSHDERVRQAHVNAVSILKKEIEKSNGHDKIILERTEAYHVARLHHMWFSSSRREKKI